MKSNTQNAKIEAITEKTLVLGIDIGSETHYARAFDHRGIEYSKKPFKFSNTEVGFVTFKEWILDLKEKHEKDKVVPGMEPTGHYWFNLGKFLQDNEMKPVLVNPHHVKKSKELDDNNPTKNDRFSWFDYRSKGFADEPKRGLRIDVILSSTGLTPYLQDSDVDYELRALEKPSDHAPIWTTFNLD